MESELLAINTLICVLKLQGTELMFVATSSGLSLTILNGFMDTPYGTDCTTSTTKHWKESPSHPRCGTNGSSKVPNMREPCLNLEKMCHGWTRWLFNLWKWRGVRSADFLLICTMLFCVREIYTTKAERIQNNYHLGLSLPTSHRSPSHQSESACFGRRRFFYDSKIFLSKTTVFSHLPHS
jgi:hypothetical protein